MSKLQEKNVELSMIKLQTKHIQQWLQKMEEAKANNQIQIYDNAADRSNPRHNQEKQDLLLSIQHLKNQISLMEDDEHELES